MSDHSLVHKLAALSRIRVADSQAVTLEKEFESILSYIARLDTLHIPLDATPAVPMLRNVTRADTTPTTPSTWTSRLVAMFPRKYGNSLSVKKIISHD